MKRGPAHAAPAALILAALAWATIGTGAALAETRVTGDLARQADPGFRTVAEGGTLTVARLVADSPAGRAGLADGDRITAIDGTGFAKAHEGEALLQRLKGDRPVTLTISRGAERREIRFTPASRPLEQYPDLDIEYGVVATSDGARLRTIVSRPKGATAKLPAILLTQWVSCGTVEMNRPGRAQIEGLARRSGLAMIRVERAGAGDSEGPACHQLDYDTEVRHYREALDALASHPWWDGQLIVWGSSLGSTTAPLVAQGRTVIGMVVQGGGAVTHLERMINFDRLQLELRGTPPAEFHERMVKSIAFQVEYLARGKSPEQIAREHPDLAGVWAGLLGTGDGVHYGRPPAWHQQAARHDFLEAWTRIHAPVLVIHGAFDQFEPEHGHRLIVDTVNRLRPGSGTFHQIPRAGHDLDLYATREDAAAFRNGTPDPELFLKPVLDWLKGAVKVG